jgi:hypothetical protein
MFEMPDARPVTIAARCVRLLAKAENLAALAPAVETRGLSRAANELLIEVRAAAVNPSDVKAATGLMPYAVFPRTPGRDYAGVVIDGPTETIGREVFGSSGDLGIRRDGTHATHLTIEVDAVVEKPSSVSWEEAAGLGVPFVTAMEGFRRAGPPKQGETVLVMGVNGKVGQAAVQIATWHGARVIGVVRKSEAYEGHSNSKVEVVDASATDVAARVRELTDGGRRHRLQHRRRSLFRGGAQIAGVARPADPDRRSRPHRAVQHFGILPRPAYLCRHRYAGLVLGCHRRGAGRARSRVCERAFKTISDQGGRDLSAGTGQGGVRCRGRFVAGPRDPAALVVYGVVSSAAKQSIRCPRNDGLLRRFAPGVDDK